ncbi:unnamed protein product, partial [Urochloa humidicola]
SLFQSPRPTASKPLPNSPKPHAPPQPPSKAPQLADALLSPLPLPLPLPLFPNPTPLLARRAPPQNPPPTHAVQILPAPTPAASFLNPPPSPVGRSAPSRRAPPARRAAAAATAPTPHRPARGVRRPRSSQPPRALADETAGGGGMKPRALLERLARPFSSRRSSTSDSRREKEEEADLEAIAAREQRAFRYEALEAATRGFSEKNRLGQGGFGPVYRGRLEDGRDVAVKRLGAGSRQGAREFRNEATLLSRVQHRNVVNLIGYCARGAEDKLLVYEYVPNESLDKILFAPAASGHCVEVVQEGPEPGATRSRRQGVGGGGAGGAVRAHRAAVRAGRPAAAAGHEARGDHPVQEAEHAGGADAAGGARVAVPAEAPRPARLALLGRVVVRDQLPVHVRHDVARVGVRVERDDHVEHAHHEEPWRSAVAPRRGAGVAAAST